MKLFAIKKEKLNNKKIVTYTVFGYSFSITKKKKYHKNKQNDIYNYEYLMEQGTKFPHPIGIVISRAATIGKNCRIYQHVTIGAKSCEEGNYDPKNYPIIGDNVTIYAGAVIAGPVKIGNNAIIGANAVVIDDVPENCVVGGIPARIIKKTASA